LFLATATSSPRLYLRIGPRIASRAAHCIATSSSHPVQRIGLQLQPDHRAQRIASQLDHRAQCIASQPARRACICTRPPARSPAHPLAHPLASQQVPAIHLQVQ